MTKPERLFMELEEYIAMSRARAIAGEEFSLKGLDEKVAVLCGVVAALPEGEKLSEAPKLQKLLADLKKLGDELAANDSVLHAEIKEIPQHRNAAVAYKKADSRDNFGKKEGK